ncbi:MAG: mannose-1-phosphate guanylyltransferase/mannose-6-phosphate isomerase [Caldimicrobium sp.]
MKAVILAGGSGTRLWPLSRKNYPKQFLRLNSERSLFQQTVERILPIVSPENIIITTNSEYKFYVLSDLKEILPNQYSLPSIIFEPVSRNTAPAIVLALKYCLETLNCSEDEIIFVTPSDHLIKPEEKFRDYLLKAERAAKAGKIITFGIKPDKPHTGYGYIKAVNTSHEVLQVERFTEKPDLETAKKYLQEGGYFWNSGMFLFRIDTILEELKKHAPKIYSLFNLELEGLISHFYEMPDISIDYAVMEKSDRLSVIPLELYWNDIGSYDALYEALEKDNKGNVFQGNVLALNTRNTFILGNKRLICTIGLEDLLIVETEDAILIARKGEAQKVREIVDLLKKEGRKEVSEHVFSHRPWGTYKVLEEGQRYKIKRIVVNPGEKLSLQRHHHRAEHWVVVRGTAKVTIDQRELFLHENESAFVPKSTLHRLENPGKIPLEIIEVQSGEYLEEDDIERFDDHYGRCR